MGLKCPFPSTPPFFLLNIEQQVSKDGIPYIPFGQRTNCDSSKASNKNRICLQNNLHLGAMVCHEESILSFITSRSLQLTGTNDWTPHQGLPLEGQANASITYGKGSFWQGAEGPLLVGQLMRLNTQHGWSHQRMPLFIPLGWGYSGGAWSYKLSDIN